MAKKKKEKESVQVDTGVLSLAEKLKRINAVTDSINNKEKRTIVGLLSDPEIQKMLDIEYIPTASPEYNEYVGGGFPRGKITIVSGREDSGKTSFVLNTIGERMQEDPEFCALWLESEESLVDTSYLFDTFGIDPARFVFVRMEKSYGAEDALNKILDYLSSNSFDIAVINTLRALIPISEIRKKMEELDVAQQARMNSRFCGKVIPLLGESKTALIIVQQRSTSTVRTTVAGDINAIGYISLGSLDDSVKAVKVDGVEVSVENIVSGDYKVARPFNIVTNGEADDGLEADFISFIMSAEGQKILADEGYIAADSNAASYEEKSEGFSGLLSIGGSTSVGPVMLKLTEAYTAIYPDVEFDVQQNGSGTGISDAIAGNVDIGMASREVAEDELSQGLVATTIARDGIAVIVNLESSVDSLTSEQIKNIYLGEITSWDEIG